MPKICLRCGAKFGSQAEYCPHDGTLLATDEHVPDPLLGSLLLEQFRVEEQIGVGGMGTVYRAHQTTFDRDVAVKVLRPELARDEQAVARFEREARLATSLDHPNLVRVFLSGRLPDGRLYIVMELLEGRSLADELDQRGTPSLERAVLMIMKLCAGLGAVHAGGIVHRDIKPENIYLVRKGRDDDFVKLVDFGVARVLEGDAIGPTTTQSGRVFGTATYISPEAATGDDTDHRSDIYSLGVLSYQLLTGELPFQGTTAGAILMQHVHEEPPSFDSRGRGGEVPEAVAAVVMRTLSKDPDARPQTVAELLDELARAAGDAGLLADARALLLGTVWGEDLAAPGSYLAELLAGGSVSSHPPPVREGPPAIVDRDPEEEAFLSSAPKPFGTTSYDLAAAPRARPAQHRWLWATLGALAVLFLLVVAGSWLAVRQPSAAEEASPPAPVPQEPADPPAPVADVVLNAPIVDQGPPAPLPEEPTEPPVAEAPAAVEEPAAPPKKKRARRKPGKLPDKRTPKPAATTPAVPPAPKPPVELEPDDGIDWTIPAFPEEPAGPTGTPDEPTRNPVVIDEVPQ